MLPEIPQGRPRASGRHDQGGHGLQNRAGRRPELGRRAMPARSEGIRQSQRPLHRFRGLGKGEQRVRDVEHHVRQEPRQEVREETALERKGLLRHRHKEGRLRHREGGRLRQNQGTR